MGGSCRRRRSCCDDAAHVVMKDRAANGDCAPLMIDLHTHTDHSDGTLSPDGLVDRAVAAGLSAIAITDHDTFAGYDLAAPAARERGLDLVCGIELSTRPDSDGDRRPPSVHLLGYFLD